MSTAISIKHRILATFNIKKNSILTACIPFKKILVFFHKYWHNQNENKHYFY